MKRLFTRVYLLFAAAIFIWGLTWPLNKMGIQYMSPLWFAALRLVIGTLGTFILLGMMRKLKWPTLKDWPIILAIGLFQLGFFTVLINLGLFYVDASRSAILTYTTPLWVLPFATYFFKEKISFFKIVGFLLGMLGVLVLFCPWSIDWSDMLQLKGNLCLMLAAFLMGVAIICARNMKWHQSPLVLLPWQLLIGTVPALLYAVYQEPQPIIVWNSTLVSVLLFSALAATALANLFATIVSKELASITVSLGFLAVPITGVLFSTLLLDEPVTLPMQIALVLIPAGIAVLSLGGRQKNEDLHDAQESK